jgi:hypothetical protein
MCKMKEGRRDSSLGINIGISLEVISTGLFELKSETLELMSAQNLTIF